MATLLPHGRHQLKAEDTSPMGGKRCKEKKREPTSIIKESKVVIAKATLQMHLHHHFGHLMGFLQPHKGVTLTPLLELEILCALSVKEEVIG